MRQRDLSDGMRAPGLARRMFALFLLATLLPLALSGWISSSAVSEIGESLTLKDRALATRQASRQTFDRLLAGKTLLTALTALPVDEVSTDALPDLGRLFREVRRTGIGESASPSVLDQAWARAAPPSAGVERYRERWSAGTTIELRAAPEAGVVSRVLLGASRGGILQWIAEFNPDYLWGPLVESDSASAWTVAEAEGHTLVRLRGADHPADGSGADLFDSRARLFLAGEFTAPDWLFVQTSPRPRVLWYGQPLTLWLALVAMGTVLSAALMGRRQIRRSLQPLELLTAGTQRLASGATGTRVAVGRNDELGTLARSFNHMAARIEDQFGWMQRLAAIDRDILGGAAFVHAAERVLVQLAVQYPAAVASITWQQGEAGLERMQVAAHAILPAAEVLHASTTCVDGFWDSAPFADAMQAGSDAAAWFADAQAAGLWNVALLPLRRQGHTEAVIALGFPTDPPGAEQLQPALELRDRLAVALAAAAREGELVHRAMHDSLTGLVNRYGLNAELDSVLGAEGPLEPLAVLLLDLDHFKDVNDSHGHDAGDELLTLVSRRLLHIATAGALVARPGGDEFAIVLRAAGEAEACAVAGAAVEALSLPFALRDSEHVVGVSIGIALHPAHGRSRTELLRCADVALYAAKAGGRGQYQLFNSALDAAASARLQLVAELRLAIERSEFVLHYQPRVRPSDGLVTSAEALVRWQHPRRGLLYPDVFISLAESSGLIESIGLMVLDRACAQMARWLVDGVRMERLSVNVSPQQLVSGELPGHVRAALKRHGLAPHALELEVTESLLVGDMDAAWQQLDELRSVGVSIALDDFGTGYSSMAVLHRLPVAVMKIDRSFVMELTTDNGAEAVIRAIVTLAKSLRLHLVAEGVETPTQAAMLAQLGCDELQGYLYSRPVAAPMFLRLPGLVHAAPVDQAVEDAVGST